jgi:hypothetical protein
MRGAVERLAPLAKVYVAGVSYDPFVSKRLSMLYRVVPLGEGSDETRMARMTKTLAAVRPVVTSQLLGAWLDARDGAGAAGFTEAQAFEAVTAQLAGLPTHLFVDPELRRDPRRMTRAALRYMAELGILERAGERYRLGATRRHPQFPLVEDVVAYQARFLEETLANAEYARGAGA